jgi:hypothetical protein
MPFSADLINCMQDVHLQNINEAGLIHATPVVKTKILATD